MSVPPSGGIFFLCRKEYYRQLHFQEFLIVVGAPWENATSFPFEYV